MVAAFPRNGARKRVSLDTACIEVASQVTWKLSRVSRAMDEMKKLKTTIKNDLKQTNAYFRVYYNKRATNETVCSLVFTFFTLVIFPLIVFGPMRPYPPPNYTGTWFARVLSCNLEQLRTEKENKEPNPPPLWCTRFMRECVVPINSSSSEGRANDFDASGE